MTTKIYLGGPIQHADNYGTEWRAQLKLDYEDNDYYEFADPMDQYNTMEEAEAEWTNRDIVEDDLAMIDGCDAPLAHWEEIPSAGTPMEIFYARREADIPVVVQTILPVENISPWIVYHANAIVGSFGAGVKKARLYARDKVIANGL